MKRRPFEPKDMQTSAHALESQPSRDEASVVLPISLIKVPDNIRANLDDIEELASSIISHGLLQPLVVSKVGGQFELVAGQRRLAALRSLEITEAPVRIINANLDQIAILKLVENIQRKELSGVDEVLAVSKLLPIFDGNQSALAEAIGKSRTYVNRCCRASAVLNQSKCATSHTLSKSLLFELADSKEPEKLLMQLEAGETKTVADARTGRAPSGALPGGRAVATPIKLREHKTGFTLKVHFDFEKSAIGDRERVISQLELILKRLKGG